MNLIDKIKKLILREIKEENEPKETAVMVRTLCLIDILFLTISAITVAARIGVAVGGIAFIGVLLILGAFALSFKIKMAPLLRVYFIALVINVIGLVLTFGLSYMFQAQLYIMFMIFYYRAAGGKKERLGLLLLSIVIVISLFSYVGTYGSIIEVSTFSVGWITILCTLYVMFKSMAIAYFFKLKFSASEDKIIRYSKKLEMLATTDPLTKLQNRRGVLNHIAEIVDNLMVNHSGLLAIAIGDIDLFKHINDTYGHDAGDYVLETLAKIMNEFMSDKGMVARWGGEEFLFTFEGVNGDFAFEEMSKLLHLVERYEFNFEGKPIKVTMTFGLEEYDDNIGIDKVITRADEKLYMGKKQGRNRGIY